MEYMLLFVSNSMSRVYPICNQRFTSWDLTFDHSFSLSTLKSKEERESQSDSGAENEDSDPSNPNSDEPDEGIDEGIDIEHATSESASQIKQKGPYVYKLFSIMVHSGTASGGHYYAYIW